MPTRKPAKKSASKKSVKSVSRPASAPHRAVHPLHKHYFLEEQEAFFRKHPLAQMLLTIFLLAAIGFFVVVYLKRDLYMPLAPVSITY